MGMFYIGHFHQNVAKRPAQDGGSFFIFSLIVAIWGLPFFHQAGHAAEITVAAYNLENYTLAASERTRIKSTAARDAVADVVAEVKPDVLGVCELGSLEALEDLRERLQKRGVWMPYFEYVDGPDLERHLALLSRLPILSRQSQARVPFDLNGSPELVRRGFLDVTLQAGPKVSLRLVGVHLKSKLPSPAGESLLRRMEALALRSLVDRIVGSDSSTRLLVYGDFNETKEDASICGVLGARGGLNSLSALSAEDANGDRWTHYRFFTDVYARIDYLMINAALRNAFVPRSARVSDSPQWRKASDHRMIYASFFPGER